MDHYSIHLYETMYQIRGKNTVCLSQLAINRLLAVIEDSFHHVCMVIIIIFILLCENR